MKWLRLGQNKCPQCPGDLKTGFGFRDQKMILCKRDCGFKISETRMEEIIAGQNKRRIEADESADRQGFGRFDYKETSQENDGII